VHRFNAINIVKFDLNSPNHYFFRAADRLKNLIAINRAINLFDRS